MSGLKGKRILVAGAGISGIAALRLLLDAEAVVTLWDSNAELALSDVQDKLRREYETVRQHIIRANEGASLFSRMEAPTGSYIEDKLRGFTFCPGVKNPADDIPDVELLVVSPGIPVDVPPISDFYKKNIPVWSEIELASRLEKGRIAAITGTNGKTTTTALLGKIMSDYMGQNKVQVVGNIGDPYTREVSLTVEGGCTVAEISSFQLETSVTFSPRVSAILNVTPDHLNRHHTMEAYWEAKEKIALYQGRDDLLVLNYDDEYCRKSYENMKDRVDITWFSSKTIPPKGMYYKDGIIYSVKDSEGEPFIGAGEVKIVGAHNMENIMAACLMADFLGVDAESIKKSVREFKAVEHRIEYVTEKGGVVYYNDSKGTNPDAAIKAIEAMDRPTVLIGGGYDKGSDYDEWMEACRGRVKALVLLGATADAIEASALRKGIKEIYKAETFEEAMELCFRLASVGDAVLLSPACASWGMFPNFEVRGRRFKEIVLAHGACEDGSLKG